MRRNKPDFTILFHSTHDGREFVHIVNNLGFALSIAHNKRLILVNEFGESFNLVRCIQGAKTRDVREKLGPDIINALPSVELVLSHIKDLNL